MRSITDVENLLNQRLTNIQELQASIWVQRNGALGEAEILFSRSKGNPDCIHTCIRAIGASGFTAMSSTDRCCPDHCPSDFGSAIKLVSQHLSDCKPLPGSLIIKTTDLAQGSTSLVKTGEETYLLVRSVWSQILGIELAPIDDGACPEEFRQQQLEHWLLSLLSQEDAARRWNRALIALQGYSYNACCFSFKNANASGLNLDGINFTRGLDFSGSNFSSASLTIARMWTDFANASFVNANFDKANMSNIGASGADFTAAQLTNALLHQANLSNAVLKSADLTNSNFSDADLRGVDLASCKSLTNTDFKGAIYNDQTRLPERFSQWKWLKWKGKGPDPYKLHVKKIADDLKPADFNGFVAHLKEHFDQDRLKKALTMLKKDRFQLFSEVNKDNLTGIVKSQTDKELFYSCRLSSDGSFACCTQNLKHCGGLRGALCKHILVLLIGLAKAGELDPTTAARWAILSVVGKSKADKESMTNVFLKYKGVELGEIDWRPTETIPEDYYAL